MRKISKILTLLLFVCSFAVILAGCAEVSDKDYVSSGLKAEMIPFDVENNLIVSSLSAEKARIIVDYESYAAYDLPLDYTEDFFEENNLLVFMTSACSSDKMQFLDILIHDGKLYPCFSRVKLGQNDPVTDDIFYLLYCAELAKADDYQLGEVIYKFR